jgi:radical SAM superfamily enzyme YgiQ (UPF0313 family)
MTVCLVSVHIKHSPKSTALAAGCLAACIKSRLPDIRVLTLEFTVEETPESCAEIILQSGCSAAGFSVYVWNRNFIEKTAALLKKSNPNMLLAAGGPETAASEISGFDISIKGEGEKTLTETLSLFKESGRVQTGLITAVPPELSSLQSPWLDGTLRLEGKQGALWELSRGCPYNCAFCFEGRGSSTVRRYPHERLKAELKLFIQNNISEIFVLDPAFNSSKTHAVKILKMIIESGTDIHFNFEIRAEKLDEELAALFSQLNCSLQLGLQSADAAVLKNVNRSINKQQFEEKVLHLHEAGCIYGFDLIYGLPGDSLAGFIKSLDFALSMLPNHLDIFPLEVLPGTELAEKAGSFNLKYEKTAPYRLLSSPSFPECELAEAEKTAVQTDIFYNSGRAVPWLSVIAANLNIRPSNIIRAFPENMLSKNRDWEELTLLQADTVEKLFLQKKLPGQAELASTLIKWYGYTAALLEEALPPSTDAEITLNPAAVFFNCCINPLELAETMENGCTELEAFLPLSEEEKGEYTVFYYDGLFNAVLFSPEETEVLKKCRQGLSRKELTPDFNTFIEDALKSHIIISNVD